MVDGALGWLKALSIAAKKLDWIILRGSVDSGNRTTPVKYTKEAMSMSYKTLRDSHRKCVSYTNSGLHK